MASGIVEGALVIDTGINNQGIIRGVKEYNRAVDSMRRTVESVGQDLVKSGNAFLRSVGQQSKAVETLNQDFERARQAVTADLEAMQRVGEMANEYRKLSRALDEIERKQSDMDWDTDEFKALDAEMERISERMYELNDARNNFEGMRVGQWADPGRFARLQYEFAKAEESLRHLDDAQESAAQLAGQYQTEIQSEAAAQTESAQAAQAQATAQEAVAEAAQEATAALEDEYQALLRAGSAISETQRRMEQSAGINVDGEAESWNDVRDSAAEAAQMTEERSEAEKAELAIVEQIRREIESTESAYRAEIEQVDQIQAAMATAGEEAAEINANTEKSTRSAIGFGERLKTAMSTAGEAARGFLESLRPVESVEEQSAQAVGRMSQETRGAAASQAELQREIAKTEAAIARLTERQEIQRRKFEAAQEAEIASAAEKFEEMNAGLEALPWEDAEQAAQQYSEDMQAHIQEAIDKFGEFEDTGTFRNTAAEIEYLNEKLVNLKAQLAGLPGDGQQLTDETEQASVAATHTSAAFGNLARSAGNAAAGLVRMVGGGVLKFLGRLAEGAKNAFVQLAKLTGRAIQTGLRTVGKLAGGAAKGILGMGSSSKRTGGDMKSGLMMILKYAFGIRSLFFLFRKLRASVKEGLGEIAKRDPQTQKSINNLIVSFNALKGALATAFQPIVTAVTPALVTFMNLLANAISMVGQFFAALTGQDYYMRSVGALNDTSKAAKGASGNVKELNRQLAGFDELNILSDKNSGGSGGSGTSGSSSGMSYEKTPLDGGIKTFVENLHALFAQGEYDKVGEAIAQGINGAFDRVRSLIDWNRIGPTVTHYVDALAGTFNGLISSIRWPDIGRTIGNGINTIAYTINHAFDTFDLAGLGQALADGLNGLVERVDFEAVATTLANLLTAKLVVVGNALARFDWEQFGPRLAGGFNSFIKSLDDVIGSIDWPGIARKMASGLNGFIRHIEWRELGDTLARRFNTAFDVLYEVVTNIKWAQLGYKFAEGINGFFGNIRWDRVGAALTKSLDGVFAAISRAVENIKWGQIGYALAAGINGILDVNWGYVGKSLANSLDGLFDLIGTAVDNIKWAQLGYDIAAGINSLFSLNWEHVAGTLSKSINGALLAIGEAIKDIKWAQIAYDFADGFNKFFRDINWEYLGKTLSKLVSGSLDWLNTAITTFNWYDLGTQIKDCLDEIDWDGIRAKLETLIRRLVEGLGDFVVGVILGDDIFKDNFILDLLEFVMPGIKATIKKYGNAGLTYGMGKKLGGAGENPNVGPGIDQVDNNKPVPVTVVGTTNGHGTAIPIAGAGVDENGNGVTPKAKLTPFDERYPKSVEANTEALEANTHGTKLTDEQYVKWGMQLYDMGYSVDDIADALKLSSEQTTMLRKAVFSNTKTIELDMQSRENGYDATKDPYSVLYTGPTSSIEAGWEWDFGDRSVTVGVDYEPNVPGGAAYKNGGVMKWLQKLFAPGVDTQTRVELIREGWKSVAAWVETLTGGNVDKAIGLLRFGWETLYSYVMGHTGGDVTKGVGVTQDKWKTIADWIIGMFLGGDVTKGVGVTNSGFATIAAWLIASFMGGAVNKGVGLTRDNWQSVSRWIASLFMGGAVNKGISLIRDNWQSVSRWIVSLFMGGDVNQPIGLEKKGWDWVDSWVKLFANTPVGQLIELAKKGWEWVDSWTKQYAKTPVGQLIELAKKGWEWVDSWVKPFAQTPVGQLIELAKKGWDWVDSWVKPYANTPVGQLVELAKKGWDWVDSWAKQYAQTPIQQQVELVKKPGNKVSWNYTTNGNNIELQAGGGIITAGGRSLGFAAGGVIRGGAARWWNGIPRYAAGTSRAHGTMFVAGEAGPEIVGHINGRTEILNKSQLAQTMYSAVTSGMLAALRGIEFRVPAMATGSVMPYEVSAQIAKSAADIQGTLDANNEDLIQTFISVIGQQTAAIVAALQRQGAAGGMSPQQVVDYINRRSMMGLQPLKGI